MKFRADKLKLDTEERKVHIYRLKGPMEPNPDYMLSCTDRAEREVLGLPYNSFDRTWEPFAIAAKAAGDKVADKLKVLVAEVDTWPVDAVSLYRKPEWPFKHYGPGPEVKAAPAPAPKAPAKKVDNASQASSSSKKVEEKPKKVEAEPDITESTTDSDAEEIQEEKAYQEAVKKEPLLADDPAAKKPGPGKLSKKAAKEIAVAENKEKEPVETWRGYIAQMCTLL